MAPNSSKSNCDYTRKDMNHAKPSMDEGSSSKRQKTTSTSFHDEDKETWVLGVHTLMPYLQKKPEAYKGTILEDSKGTPIVAFAHQMGSPAAPIIVREMVSNKIMTNEFKLGETVFNSDAKYVFRVGSAAGINCYNGPEEEKKQDISPCLGSLLSIVCARLGRDLVCGLFCNDSINSLSLSHVEEVKEKLKKMGYIFQNGWPVLRTDANTVKLLRSSIEAKLNAFNASRGEGQLKAGKVVCLGNVSKDSLYAETAEKAFVELRRTLDTGCSEMEFATITRVGAHKTMLGDRVKTAMSACILGSIPGDSFAELDKSVISLQLGLCCYSYSLYVFWWCVLKCSKVTESALVGTLETLHEISKSHR
eukprot:jgi/Bigna1/76482/fgenesh1_pg.41_\